jgi:hypothetical protein
MCANAQRPHANLARVNELTGRPTGSRPSCWCGPICATAPRVAHRPHSVRWSFSRPVADFTLSARSQRCVPAQHERNSVAAPEYVDVFSHVLFGRRALA